MQIFHSMTNTKYMQKCISCGISHLVLQIVENISYLLINVLYFKKSYICLGSSYNKNIILIVTPHHNVLRIC